MKPIKPMEVAADREESMVTGGGWDFSNASSVGKGQKAGGGNGE